MPSYMMIGRTVVGSAITDGKKVDVLAMSMRPGRSVPTEISRTLDGDSVISMGVSKRVWAFDAKVPITPATGYASLTDVEGWYSDVTAANNLYKLQDMAGTTIYNVLLANKDTYAPEPLSFDLYGSTAIWKVRMEWIEQ